MLLPFGRVRFVSFRFEDHQLEGNLGALIVEVLSLFGPYLDCVLIEATYKVELDLEPGLELRVADLLSRQ
jgi:hypothetical protein